MLSWLKIEETSAMAQIRSYFIEEISAFHPNLELEGAMLAAVGIMKAHSSSQALLFNLERHNFNSQPLNTTEDIQLQIQWRAETESRAENVLSTYQRNRIVEDAAFAISCVLFPKFVSSGLSVALYGDRADYWTDKTQFLVEISGTENPRAFRQRHRKKIKQLLSNPYDKGGFVVVCDFSKQRILLSFHEGNLQT
jgi:hypothetical protein